MRRINYEPANQDMPVTGEILDMVPARRGFSRGEKPPSAPWWRRR